MTVLHMLPAHEGTMPFTLSLIDLDRVLRSLPSVEELYISNAYLTDNTAVDPLPPCGIRYVALSARAQTLVGLARYLSSTLR